MQSKHRLAVDGYRRCSGDVHFYLREPPLSCTCSIWLCVKLREEIMCVYNWYLTVPCSEVAWRNNMCNYVFSQNNRSRAYLSWSLTARLQKKSPWHPHDTRHDPNPGDILHGVISWKYFKRARKPSPVIPLARKMLDISWIISVNYVVGWKKAEFPSVELVYY